MAYATIRRPGQTWISSCTSKRQKSAITDDSHETDTSKDMAKSQKHQDTQDVQAYRDVDTGYGTQLPAALLGFWEAGLRLDVRRRRHDGGLVGFVRQMRTQISSAFAQGGDEAIIAQADESLTLVFEAGGWRSLGSCTALPAAGLERKATRRTEQEPGNGREYEIMY